MIVVIINLSKNDGWKGKIICQKLRRRWHIIFRKEVGTGSLLIGKNTSQWLHFLLIKIQEGEIKSVTQFQFCASCPHAIRLSRWYFLWEQLGNLHKHFCQKLLRQVRRGKGLIMGWEGMAYQLPCQFPQLQCSV